jgi:hypothetical protein
LLPQNFFFHTTNLILFGFSAQTASGDSAGEQGLQGSLVSAQDHHRTFDKAETEIGQPTEAVRLAESLSR